MKRLSEFMKEGAFDDGTDDQQTDFHSKQHSKVKITPHKHIANKGRTETQSESPTRVSVPRREFYKGPEPK